MGHMKDNGWQQFLSLCQSCQTPEALDEFFKFILTPDEQVQLAGRVEIVAALLKGELTQREIAHKHNISIAKITRGSNMLKLCSQRLHDFLNDELSDS